MVQRWIAVGLLGVSGIFTDFPQLLAPILEGLFGSGGD
jgi:hypothetical protein